MKKLFTSFFLSSFLLGACSQNMTANLPLSHKVTTIGLKEAVGEEFFPSSYTIVSVGDSLTQGVGDSTKSGGYVPYLEQLLEGEKSVKEVIFHNFGVSGNRTEQILNRLKTTELRNAVKEADMVLITTGGNDIMKVVRENFPGLQLSDFDNELRKYEGTLTAMLNTIRSENPDVLIGFIGLYNPFYQFFTDIEEMNIVMDNWNLVSQSVLSQYDQTYFIDVAQAFRESEEHLLHTDYFHPNNKGYELIAQQAFSTLQEQALTILADKKYIALKKENAEDE